jgi:uncharacterized protein YjbJ (UPF0337 family)
MSAGMMKKKGQAKEVKGKVIAAVGRVTGNDRMRAAGRADLAEGKAQSALGDSGLKVKKFTKKIVGKR